MTTYDIQDLSVEQLDDLYDIICEYIYEHNFDEEYILGDKAADLELDDTTIEIKDKDAIHIEVGVIDDNIVLANYKMGFLYTFPDNHADDYKYLQNHVEDTVQQFL